LSQFELVSDSEKIINKKIVAGERRQFGESMSNEVAKVLGLNYEKLCVAAVVQQGELGRIIESSPKEFKELLNSLIGIERLDAAFQTMHEVIQGFRERLRDETGGFVDGDINRVEGMKKDNESKLLESESLLSSLEEQRVLMDEKLRLLEKEIDMLTPLTLKAGELQKAESLLVRHVSERRNIAQGEAARLEKLAAEARRSLDATKNTAEVNMRLQMVKAELEENQSEIVENEGAIGKLKGFAECAGRLQIADGRCPVCDSPMTTIKNNKFDTAHIQSELGKRSEEKLKFLQERAKIKKEETFLVEQNTMIAAAVKFLENSGVGTNEDIMKLEVELGSKKKDLAGLPVEILRVGEDPAGLVIDDTSKFLAKEIISLREQVKGFSQKRYTDSKLEKDRISRQLLDTNKQIGTHQRATEDARNNVDLANKILRQLKEASDFIRFLDNIRSVIFNRDGHVGMSLRSWALKVVSAKASEYAAMFNIGISRIELGEDRKDVRVLCYGRQGEIDMDSLSGGEKVAVALALRLGIAYIMGSSRLDFIILDEPTTHLDEVRRKALVKIISEAFREGAGPLAQMVIITHDSEIFEDSEVDRVYKFVMTADGSRVVTE